MLRWRGRSSDQPQVANGRCGIDPRLTPASEAPADAVRAAWLPVLTGQPVPRLGERTYAEPDDDC